MKLSHLTSGIRPIEVEIDGEKLKLSYRVSGMTPETMDLIAASDKLPGSAAVKATCDVIESWDLEGDNGEPVPIEPEWIRTLPFGFLTTILEAITADINPNPTKSRRSKSGSSMMGH